MRKLDNPSAGSPGCKTGNVDTKSWIRKFDKIGTFNIALKIVNLLTVYEHLDCIESLRFPRSSEVTLGQGLLRKGGGVSIYLLLNCLVSIYVTKNGVIYLSTA